MSVSYRRESIGKGAEFTELIDTRLKTNNLYFHFLEPLSEKNASANAVLPKILTDSCEDYPDITSLNRRLASLYGAYIQGGVSKLGDNHVISMLCSWIADRFTIDGECISNEVIDTFLKCITEPYLENGCFPKSEFETRKQELLNEIDAEINDKRGYAIRRAIQHIFKGEAARFSVYGERSNAEQLTPEAAYSRYKELLRTARIEVVFAGYEFSEENKRKLFEAVNALERDNIVSCETIPSPAKTEPVRVTEKMDIVQSKLIMAYKTSCTDTAVLMMFNEMFGGSPNSKLFNNVREKLSLCYYCSSAAKKNKGVMYLDSGVEHSNITAAEKEIVNQLEAMKNGDFTDEEIENARLSITNVLKGINDSPRKISEWYFRQCTEDEIISPEDRINEINKVTREDIISAAGSMIPDTVYVLTGKETE